MKTSHIILNAALLLGLLLPTNVFAQENTLKLISYNVY